MVPSKYSDPIMHKYLLLFLVLVDVVVSVYCLQKIRHRLFEPSFSGSAHEEIAVCSSWSNRCQDVGVCFDVLPWIEVQTRSIVPTQMWDRFWLVSRNLGCRGP